MGIIAKYKFNQNIHENFLPVFNDGFTYTITDSIDTDGFTIRTIESDSLPTLIKFGDSSSAYENIGILSLLKIDYVNIHNGIKTLYNFLANARNLISVNTNGWDTSNITDMYCTFYNCLSLTSLNVSNFDTGQVTNMYCMFYNCSSLTSLDVSNFNTSRVINIDFMFRDCSELTSLDVSNFNLDNSLNIANMLKYCSKLINIGMIYCNSSTINKIVDLLSTNTTIWYQDANLSELTPLPNITYKEYKCTTVETDILDGIVLRAIGDVRDELNLLTGKLTQRIGEIVFDGSQHWTVASTEYSDGVIFQYDFNLNYGHKLVSKKIICDSFPTLGTIWKEGGGEGIAINGSFTHIQIKSSNCTSSNEFKSWLTTNPIIVQYELSTPIIKTVDLTKINQDNEGLNYISSYDTVTHFETSSESLFPTVSISPVSYPVTLKTNTTYTLMFNKVETSNNPLVVNLGGAQIQLTNGEDIATITTPNTLANQNITWYGAGHKVSEIMVLEGNIEKLPYFEGSVPSRISTLTTVHDNGIRENTLTFNEEIILHSNNTTKDTLDLLTGQLIRYFDTNGNLLETPTTETVTYTVYNNGASDDVLALIPDDNIIFDSAICPRLSYEFDVIRERLFSYNTISSKELYTKDENFAIVYGDHRGEVLPQLDEMTSCINPSITFSDGSNSNTHEIEGTFRSVGTKFDEVDVINNTATINFGTFTLDGTENWVFLGSNTNTTGAYVRDYLVDAPTTNNVLSTCSIGCGNASDSLSDEEGVYLNGFNRYVYVRINNDKLQSQDVAGIVAYLNENPIEVIYQLANPITMNINVTSDGAMVSYEDVTYVSLTSDSGVLPHETTVQVAAKTRDVVDEVSTLSLRQNETEEQIEEQSDENLISMIATTEIYENLL